MFPTVRSLCTAALVLTCLAAAPRALAQTADSAAAPRRIVLTDGSVLVGVVADPEADTVRVQSANGVEQRVARARIAQNGGLIGGRFSRADPTRTRTVIAPTARTLGRGETRLSTTAYILPSVTTGLTDRVDAYGSLVAVFGDGGAGVAVVGAKGAVLNTEGLAVSVGSTFVLPFSSADDVTGSFGVLPYAVATVGDEARSLSVSAMGAFGGSVRTGNVAAGEGVVLAAGGEFQLTNGIKLLADAYVPVGAGSAGVLVLPGVRFFSDRFSADLYGFVATDGRSTPAGFAPLANFSYRF